MKCLLTTVLFVSVSLVLPHVADAGNGLDADILSAVKNAERMVTRGTGTLIYSYVYHDSLSPPKIDHPMLSQQNVKRIHTMRHSYHVTFTESKMTVVDTNLLSDMPPMIMHRNGDTRYSLQTRGGQSYARITKHQMWDEADFNPMIIADYQYFYPTLHAHGSGRSIRCAGKKEFRGTLCDIIEIADETHESPIIVWADPVKSHLPLKIQNISSDDTLNKTEFTFEFREFPGNVYYPSRIYEKVYQSVGDDPRKVVLTKEWLFGEDWKVNDAMGDIQPEFNIPKGTKVRNDIRDETYVAE